MFKKMFKTSFMKTKANSHGSGVMKLRRNTARIGTELWVKAVLIISTLTLPLFSQATFTQGVAPVPAKPSQLFITNGGPTCTVSGDTFPATKITVGSCTFGGVILPSFTVPNNITIPWALTIQVNSGASASTFILQVTSTSPFTIQATVNGATPVGGTF